MLNLSSVNSISSFNNSNFSLRNKHLPSLPIEVFSIILTNLHNEFNPNSFLYQSLAWNRKYRLVNRFFNERIIDLIKVNSLIKNLDFSDNNIDLGCKIYEQINLVYEVLIS